MRRCFAIAMSCLVAAFLSSLLGCTPRVQTDAPEMVLNRANEKGGHMIAIQLDLSGSFQHQMVDGGHAYKFAMAVIDRYFRSKIGINDRLLISRVSGSQRSLIWQGTPLELRRTFPDANAFAEHLRHLGDDPGGSLVFDSLRQTVEFVMGDPEVESGAKAAIFCLSDMQDTSGSSEALMRLEQTLTDYGRRGHTLGLYYVDQLQTGEWRDRLRNCGIRNYVVEADILGKPQLPSFD